MGATGGTTGTAISSPSVTGLTTKNLFDLTYRVARGLNMTYEGYATTNATSTSLIDTVGLARFENDFFNKNSGLGTVWVLYDAGAASGSPEGKWATVTDFVQSTQTATIADVTDAITAGDRYAIATEEFPLDLLISEINSALMDMGPIPYTDTSTITTADNKTEYTLPVAMAGGDLKQVFLQIDDDDANDNRWEEIFNWYVEQSAIGTADELIVPYQYSSGYVLKLVYVAPHPELYIYTDELSEHVPLERVVFPAVLGCLRYKKQESGSDRYDDQILKWEVKTEKAMLTRSIRIPSRPGKRMILRAVGTKLESEPDKVYL